MHNLTRSDYFMFLSRLSAVLGYNRGLAGAIDSLGIERIDEAKLINGLQHNNATLEAIVKEMLDLLFEGTQEDPQCIQIGGENNAKT